MSSQRMGLGENIVQNTVDQDEYQVFKPLVSDDYFVSIIDASAATTPSLSPATGQTTTSKAERVALVLSGPENPQNARWACTIDTHYDCPMDMAWRERQSCQ
ncbi:hypothetical protein AtubIFM55763_010046 [Aspergillus tubingensis]|uniref:Pyruvate phosphate dikinase AMP/ATP-binding domain-containing protein n=1 Tax=Aspergillus tubingensis TaxID=5068 RepID=A0A9W6AJI0_ASPTU|nr:hypothetical protein AtubIFM54640_003234 [Aspergillus tubingensis]GLA77855.1 hypothetical protein AtubIFM55763_010046 [Aspergillus tubingensis]GLA81951.1 hypothetical protein AtubIFM56815_006130 [Aspergillus tubingensis]GLB18188.1 hypothetical protein AtubIFM61612_008079 [Aspergillus tubingensis]